jgi:16S rRNA (cytidine1402-2'-O)-methyltransferase
MTENGILYIVGTPLGNRDDITLRALKTIARVEIIVCEDTRVTQRLLGLYSDELWTALGGRPGKLHLARLDESFEMKMIPKVITWLEEGTSVALVTDAGMPCVSDPGWRVVNSVREAGFTVEVIPGPSALTTAMSTVGMDMSRVWFVGFLAKKPGKRKEMLMEAKRQLDSGTSTAAIFYESPMRLKQLLEEIKTHLGPACRQGRGVTVAACGELTKQHERIIRGTAEVVLGQLSEDVKGEWVVVIGAIH